jgi:ERCC4-type nuclease
MSNSEIKLIIDSRERKIKSYFKNHKKKTITDCVSTQNLDIGDILFKLGDETLILIERKTIEDLGSSILDGRHKEQKFRIQNSTIPKNRVIFLIEGEMQDLSFGKIKKNTLLGAIQNTMFRDGFSVYRNKNI